MRWPESVPKGGGNTAQRRVLVRVFGSLCYFASAPAPPRPCYRESRPLSLESCFGLSVPADATTQKQIPSLSRWLAMTSTKLDAAPPPSLAPRRSRSSRAREGRRWRNDTHVHRFSSTTIISSEKTRDCKNSALKTHFQQQAVHNLQTIVDEPTSSPSLQGLIWRTIARRQTKVPRPCVSRSSIALRFSSPCLRSWVGDARHVREGHEKAPDALDHNLFSQHAAIPCFCAV